MSAQALKAADVVSPWMKTKEAAAYIGSTEQTLRAWRAYGRGPKYHSPSARVVRYFRDDLDAFLRGESAR